MKDCIISINQLADFHIGTEAKKKRIIKQQKTPNPFLTAWYQMSKARIKKSLQNNGDLAPVFKGIEELKNRKPEKKRQITDRIVSIEAMHRFVQMKLPKLLLDTEYEVIKKVKKKSFILNGVEVLISPDVIIKGKVDGQVFIGGFKLHVSKSGKFNREQQSIVASCLYKFLEEEIAGKDEIVLPELCISLDIFGEGLVTPSANIENTLKNVGFLCDEIKQYWNAA